MLSRQDLEQYEEQGFLVIEDVLLPSEVACLNRNAEALFAQDTPDRVFEKDGKTTRGVHGCHERNEVCHDLVRHPKLLGPAMQILQTDLYVHQFKINAKLPVHGDVWQWHQDYTFWELEDGMPRPQAVNVAVLNHDATEFNGPLLFVPGSHRVGRIETDSAGKDNDGEDFWAAHLSASLDHPINMDALSELVRDRGIVSATGPAGSIVIFSPCLAHGSGSNMAPYPRGMTLVSYNRMDNRLLDLPRQRPEFLAARENAVALQPLDEDFVLVDRASAMST